jgi:hypothetical protein
LAYGTGLALESEGINGIFRSYLFATKGLDLAIPSRREFVKTAIFDRTMDTVIDVEEDIPYKGCQDISAKLQD